MSLQQSLLLLIMVWAGKRSLADCSDCTGCSVSFHWGQAMLSGVMIMKLSLCTWPTNYSIWSFTLYFLQNKRPPCGQSQKSWAFSAQARYDERNQSSHYRSVLFLPSVDVCFFFSFFFFMGALIGLSVWPICENAAWNLVACSSKPVVQLNRLYQNGFRIHTNKNNVKAKHRSKISKYIWKSPDMFCNQHPFRCGYQPHGSKKKKKKSVVRK